MPRPLRAGAIQPWAEPGQHRLDDAGTRRRRLQGAPGHPLQPRQIGEVLRRNVYLPGPVPADDRVEALARHLLALDRRLAAVGDAELLAGRLGAAARPGDGD